MVVKNFFSEFCEILSLQILFYRLQFAQTLKSPLNFWIASLIQIVYFASQGFFWFAVLSTEAGRNWMSESQIFGFMVTVGIVDNFYLFTIGRGSMVLMQRVETRNLEPILLWPRSSLGILVFMTPNMTYLPCAIISLVCFICYHFYYSTDILTVALHFFACIVGVFVMNGISFVFRSSIFWSQAFARLRNANPSYKILVRPFDSFEGAIKVFLLTLFPALFITGVPAELGTGQKEWIWLVGAIGACAFNWWIVVQLWTLGLRRYNLKAN
jgi:ABC-type uncharacterized transport system permease subunit